jgi:hypothetical protein
MVEHCLKCAILCVQCPPLQKKFKKIKAVIVPPEIAFRSCLLIRHVLLGLFQKMYSSSSLGHLHSLWDHSCILKEHHLLGIQGPCSSSTLHQMCYLLSFPDQTNLVLIFTSCMTLGVLFHLLKLKFVHLQNSLRVILVQAAMTKYHRLNGL